MRTDYFADLLPDFVTSVTRQKPELVTPETQSPNRGNNELDEALPALPLLPQKERSAEHEAAISEHLAERAAIMEYDGGLTQQEAEAEAKRALRVYEYRLAENPDTWLILIAPNCNLEEAARTCRSKFGSDRVLEVRDYHGFREADK